jgi:hypothetical protein
MREGAMIDEWQTVMLLKALDVGKVHLYTEGLSLGERAATGVVVIDNLEETIGACVERDPERRLAVIPEGPYVAPYVVPFIEGSV